MCSQADAPTFDIDRIREALIRLTSNEYSLRHGTHTRESNLIIAVLKFNFGRDHVINF